MKRMLINATQPEELRVAIVNGQTLDDLDIEIQSREQKKANIYKARITRIEPSLEACFVDYGAERHGFLPMREIHTSYYKSDSKDNAPIAEALREGQEVLVQVEKEERGNKGAALTTFISLASRYLVLMPNNQRGGGVSRQITGVDRKDLKNNMRQLEIPDGMGLIARTSGVGRDLDELQWDCDYLMQLWAAIQAASDEHKAPHLIYQESSLIIRALRDYLRSDIGEILIDKQSVHDDAVQFMQQVMPHNLGKLKFYDSPTPLFSRFQIESQIESAYCRDVNLISGGSIVLDKTEALISIDINSARATKGTNIEDTALNTNLEAADEIARQLRIRDLGGLVVIDFIDMLERDNQRKVEDRLMRALSRDKARTQVGKISRFGLLEMSRQRLRPSLEESTQNVCPRCDGHGFIRSVESLALSVLRLVEEEVMKESTGEVIAKVPNAVGNFLLNEKRHGIAQIEVRHRVPILIINSPHIETPHFEIERIRRADLRIDTEASYELVKAPQIDIPNVNLQQTAAEKPAVSNLSPTRPAPTPAPNRASEPAVVKATTTSTGLFGWMKSLFSNDNPAQKPERTDTRKGSSRRNNTQNRAQSNRNNSGKTSENRDQKDPGNKSQSNHPSQRRNKRGQKPANQRSTNNNRNNQSRSGQNQQSPAKQADSTDTNTDQNASGQARKPRRSRSRRRPKSQNNQQNQQGQQGQNQAADNQRVLQNNSAQKPTQADSNQVNDKPTKSQAEQPSDKAPQRAANTEKTANSSPADKNLSSPNAEQRRKARISQNEAQPEDNTSTVSASTGTPLAPKPAAKTTARGSSSDKDANSQTRPVRKRSPRKKPVNKQETSIEAESPTTAAKPKAAPRKRATKPVVHSEDKSDQAQSSAAAKPDNASKSVPEAEAKPDKASSASTATPEMVKKTAPKTAAKSDSKTKAAPRKPAEPEGSRATKDSKPVAVRKKPVKKPVKKTAAKDASTSKSQSAIQTGQKAVQESTGLFVLKPAPGPSDDN